MPTNRRNVVRHMTQLTLCVALVATQGVAALGAELSGTLAKNPSDKSGAAPYALLDDAGRILREIEPSPGLDVQNLVGRSLRVKHDTGGTLLSSQLEPIEAPAPRKLTPAVDAKPINDTRISRAQYERTPQRTAQQVEALPLPPADNQSEGPLLLEDIIGDPVLPSSPQGPAPTPMQGPVLAVPQTGEVVGPVQGAPACGCGATCSEECYCGGYGNWGAGLNCGWLHGLGQGWRHHRGVDFSVDLLWLRTHDSAARSGGADFELGSRWELGLRGPQNRRFAIRYFEYSTDTALGAVDVETFDLEWQRGFRFGSCGEWGIGGGLRFAEYGELGGLNYDESIGPVIGLYARAPAIRGLDGIFHLRQSYQFGDATGVASDRGVFGITELQFGLEHRRRARAGEWFARGLFETQYWDGPGRNPTADSARGMIGFGLGLGLRR